MYYSTFYLTPQLRRQNINQSSTHILVLMLRANSENVVEVGDGTKGEETRHAKMDHSARDLLILWNSLGDIEMNAQPGVLLDLQMSSSGMFRSLVDSGSQESKEDRDRSAV